ncbi:MAG: quinolinate synthase NadA [Bacillota bacterium]
MRDFEQEMEEINRLKREKNAVVLAHYYQTGDVQDAADFVGDSFALSRIAKDTAAGIIVFCGVLFMAESAKILSPQKTVLLPVPDAGCPMADMVTPEDVRALRIKYPEAAVVCYVNSSCAVKAESDVCVTSSNAVRIVLQCRERQIIFVPDRNLGGYVARHVPDKEVILHPGYCRVHHRLTAEDADKAKASVPDALLLAHPECQKAVLDKADFIGSTAQILRYAAQSQAKTFLIGTEMGVLHALKRDNPGKRFFLLSPKLLCSNMKKTRLSDLRDALLYERHVIELDEAVMDKARRCLSRMLEMA